MPAAERLLASLLLFAGASAGQALRDPMIGVVLGPDGAPAAGAVVTATRSGHGMIRMPPPVGRDDLRQVDAARTDDRGRFALQLPVGLPCRVAVDHPRFAKWQRDGILAAPDWTIRLAEPASYRCELTLASGPPAAAQVRGLRVDTGDEVFRGRTDDQGKLLVARVEPGELFVELTPEAAPSPEPRRIALVAGAEHVDVVRCEAGQTLTGRVVDEQGAAVAGALVGEGWDLHRAVTTDAEGRYTLRGRGSWLRAPIFCAAPGFVRQQSDARRTDATADFRLRQGHSVLGRVVDERGEPIEGVRVHAFGLLSLTGVGHADVAATRTAEDGSFELRGVSSDCEHALVLQKDGRGTLVHWLPREITAALRRDTDLAMPSARFVVGTLRDAQGAPIANAMVCLEDRTGLRGPYKENGRPDILWPFVARRWIRSDHACRFAFGDLPDGEFVLTATDGHGHTYDVEARVKADTATTTAIDLRTR